jgi:hypothetical protein
MPNPAVVRNAERLRRAPDPLSDTNSVNHLGSWEQEKKFFTAVPHGQDVIFPANEPVGIPPARDVQPSPEPPGVF